MSLLSPSTRPLIDALQAEVDAHEALAAAAAHGGLDPAGSAAAAEAAARAYADALWLQTVGPNAESYISASTVVDFTANNEVAGYYRVAGAMLWPDGDSGHIDAVKYTSDGLLQYYTASKREKIIVQSPLVGGVPAFSVITPDYYVDSNASDGGDGSYEAPFNSFADLSLIDGDVVALASGSEFSDTLMIPDGASVYRYGAGAKPIIDAGNDFTAGSWGISPGATNAYRQDVLIGLHSSKSWINVTEDGAFLVRVDDAAACDATPGSYAVSMDVYDGETTVAVWIHATNSSNPATNGKSYRYSRRKYAIVGEDGDAGPDSVTIDGIEARLQTSENGSVRVGRSSTVRHVEVVDGNKHSIFFEDGATLLDIDVRNAYYNEISSTMLVLNEDTPAGLDNLIGEVSVTSDREVVGGSLLTAHNNTSGSFGDTLVRRAHVTDLTIGISSTSDMDEITYERCYVAASGRGASLSAPGQAAETNFNYCYFDLDAAGAGIGINFNNGGSQNLTVFNTTIIGHGGTMAQAIIYFDDGVLDVRNCTFSMSESTGGTRRGLQTQDEAATLNSFDNVFLGNFSRYVHLNAESSYFGDRNCYEGNDFFYAPGIGVVNFGSWQTYTGEEANSTEGDCV